MELRIAGHSPIDLWYAATNDPEDPTDYVVEDEKGVKTGLRRVRIIPLLDPADFSGIYPDMPGMEKQLYIAVHYWGEWNQCVGRGPVTATYKTFPFYCEQSESISVKAFYGVSPEQIKEKFGPMPHFTMISTTYGDAALDMEPFQEARREIAAIEALKKMGVSRPDGVKAYDLLRKLQSSNKEVLRILQEAGVA